MIVEKVLWVTTFSSVKYWEVPKFEWLVEFDILRYQFCPRCGTSRRTEVEGKKCKFVCNNVPRSTAACLASSLLLCPYAPRRTPALAAHRRRDSYSSASRPWDSTAPGSTSPRRRLDRQLQRLDFNSATTGNDDFNRRLPRLLESTSPRRWDWRLQCHRRVDRWCRCLQRWDLRAHSPLLIFSPDPTHSGFNGSIFGTERYQYRALDRKKSLFFFFWTTVICYAKQEECCTNNTACSVPMFNNNGQAVSDVVLKTHAVCRSKLNISFLASKFYANKFFVILWCRFSPS